MNILSKVVLGAGKWLRLTRGIDLQRQRRAGNTLIGKDLGPLGMVHHEQRIMVNVVGFPKLRRNAEVVITVAWDEPFAGYFEPLFCLIDGCYNTRVDMQSQTRRQGSSVLHKAHLFP